MAAITKSQILKINGKCANGFRFDIGKFQLRGDKDLSKNIELTETKMIKATLFFHSEINNFRHTSFHIPVMNVSVWTKSNESAFWSSSLGKLHYFKEYKTSRRSMSVLQDITVSVTNDMIMQMVDHDSSKPISSIKE